MSEIVKVQLPLFPPDSLDALIYDKRHKHMTQTPVPGVRRKMGSSMKAFFHATWDGKAWLIGERVPDQSW